MAVLLAAIALASVVLPAHVPSVSRTGDTAVPLPSSESVPSFGAATPAVPGAGPVSSAGSVVETLLPNYNGSLPGNFPSSVEDWQVGTPAVVPTMGTLWLPEIPTVAHAPAAPAAVYNLSSNSFEGIVPALSNASAIAYDSGNGFLYACDPGTNSVEVFDPLTDTVIQAAIPVGVGPDAIAYDSVNQYLFVANAGSNNVTVIDGLTNPLVTPGVPVGDTPVSILVDARDGWVYVANANSSYLSVLNATTPTAGVSQVPLLGAAFALAYSGAARTVAATFPDSANLTIIDSKSKVVLNSQVPVGPGNAAITVTLDGTAFVLANRSGAELSFVSSSHPYSISNTTVSVGAAPAELSVDPATGSILSWSSAARDLTVVNASSRTVLANSPTLGPQPSLLAASPSTSAVYVGDSALPRVEVLNATSGRALSSPLSLETAADSLATDSAIHTLFVGSSGAVDSYDEVSGYQLRANALLPGANGPLIPDDSSEILWVGRGTGEVTGLNMTTLQPVANVTGLRVSPQLPEGMVFDGAASLVFAVNSTTGAVAAFDAVTGKVVDPAILAGANITSLAFDGGDGLVYAAGDALVAIDPTTLTLVGTPLVLPVHSGETGLAFDPSKDLLYVSTSAPGSGLGTIWAVGGSSPSDLSGPVVSIPDGLGPTDLTVYSPEEPDLIGSDIVLSANALSGTVGLIATPPVISSFAFTPSTIDVGQTTRAVVTASGGAGVSSVSYTGLPSGCTTRDTFVLECTPSANGTWNVTVTVSDSVGNSASSSAYLNVGPTIQLSASFGTLPIAEVDAGKLFSLSAAATGGTPPYVFSWNFGDGGSAVGAAVTHTFAEPGTYPVVVKVTDSVGASTVDAASVHVYSLPSVTLVAPHNASTDVFLPLPIVANEVGGTTPGSGTMDFGDGNTSTESVTSHAWAKTGVYEVTYTYRDASGFYANATLTIHVNSTLTGTFSATPVSPSPVPGTVFDFAANIQGGTPPYVVVWSFGNGSYCMGDRCSTSFPTVGTFTVGVKVVDAANGAQEANLPVTVGSPSGASPSIFGGNFGPGLVLGLFVGMAVAAVVLFSVERSRRRTLPAPPSPYVPPPAGPGKRT